MHKKAQFSSIKWNGRSVSGLVVIAGLIIYFFDNKFLGVFLIIAGLVAAFLMSPSGRGLLKR